MRRKYIVFMTVLVVLQLYASLWALPAAAYNKGEFFRVNGREIHLLRSLQKVAIRYVPGQGSAIRRSLEATRASKHPYYFDSEVRELGIAILQIERLKSLNDLDECIYQLEQYPDIERAVPVFIHEESGLEVICTDRFIVKLAAGANLADLDAINKRLSTTIIRRLRGTTDQFLLEFPRCTVKELLATCEVYYQDPGIEWAEPDFLGQVTKRNFNPNDPLYLRQWHLKNTGQLGGKVGADINASEAWSITTGSDQIIIAIIDDGVDLEHEDLRQNIAVNPKEQPGDANGDGRPGIAGVDDDGDGLIDEDSWGLEPGDFWYINDLVNDDDENGYKDDFNGWDFYDDDNDPSPIDVDDYHGTMVAGVVAAKGNNSIGVAGCAFDCKLMPLKVIRGDYYYLDTVSEVIRYAAGISQDGNGRWRGADVLNISLGWSETNSINNALIAANTQGRNGKGCPIFCAVRQDGEKIPVTAWKSYELSGFSSGYYTFTWEYEKDGSGSGGDDTVWIDDVVFPGGVTEGFEGSFPPNGWEREGDAYWISYGVPNRVLGTGNKSARSGDIGNNQLSRLETTKWVGSGSVSFYRWVSSQPGDVFRFKVNEITYVTEDGYLEVNSDLDYPENHPATIAVGASTSFDYHAEYSSYGAGLDFVAPGNDIWTTDRMGDAGYAGWNDEYSNYIAEQGTSFACPLAAGVAALMLSEDSDLTADEVRSIMQQTCRKIGGIEYDSNGWNEYYGYGCIDAKAAVDALKPVDAIPPSPNPSTWATPPYATGTMSIRMVATTAMDDRYGVEYYFNNTTVGGHDSGWQSSSTFEDTYLSPDTLYTYQVKTRDTSPQQNETGWSSRRSARTKSGTTSPPDINSNVLICGADTNNGLQDIQQKLQETGQFERVSILNIGNNTPSLNELKNYCAVLVYSNSNYNTTALGNVMADYVDWGGGVVCMMFEVATRSMQGRWSSGQYNAISRGSAKYGPQATLGTVFQPKHAIMKGVTSFDGGPRSFRTETLDISPGAIRVADWSDGRPLVVTKLVGSTRRVDLAFYPVSSDVDGNCWDSSTDGALLMVNSLAWVARGPGNLMPLPEFDRTFYSEATRGYWFEAPISFRITGLRVPDEDDNGRQNVEVVRFNNQTPPPAYDNTTNNFVSLARLVGEQSGSILSVNIPVSTGDIIGILGAAGTSLMYNSYGVAGDFVSNIDGHSVILRKMGMDFNLYEYQARNLWQGAGSQIGRVEMWYIID